MVSVFGSEGAFVVVDEVAEVDGVAVVDALVVDDAVDELVDVLVDVAPVAAWLGAALSQPASRTAEVRQARATAGARGRMIAECRSA
jgi:hypothetical protein